MHCVGGGHGLNLQDNCFAELRPERLEYPSRIHCDDLTADNAEVFCEVCSEIPVQGLDIDRVDARNGRTTAVLHELQRQRSRTHRDDVVDRLGEHQSGVFANLFPVRQLDFERPRLTGREVDSCDICLIDGNLRMHLNRPGRHASGEGAIAASTAHEDPADMEARSCLWPERFAPVPVVAEHADGHRGQPRGLRAGQAVPERIE